MSDFVESCVFFMCFIVNFKSFRRMTIMSTNNPVKANIIIFNFLIKLVVAVAVKFKTY